MNIKTIHARQILDSRGNPTVECDVRLEDNSVGRASVPSGASTGIHEAVELRDNNPQVFHGKGVTNAVRNVQTEIAEALIGANALDQEAIDQRMIELDGTENKGRLGANAILAVSLATLRAAANSERKPLYEYVGEISGKTDEQFLMPVPMMNIINGGKHGGWGADIQEFMIIPKGAQSFHHAVQMGSEIFHSLATVLEERGYGTTVGDEGGYAPVLKHGNSEAFELITNAVTAAGYSPGPDVGFGIDAASSEFFKDGVYHLKSEQKELSTDQLCEYWKSLKSTFPLYSMEDPFDQEDWRGWQQLTAELGNQMQIVGDDLLVTNTTFLKKGIETKAANAILVKVNQIGTVTETINAVKMAKAAGWNAIISHRSGETEDTTIAHLVVGLGTGQIKTGSLSRTDRVAKYNELMRIAEQLGNNAIYKGSETFT